MADIALGASDLGSYEIALAAGVPQIVRASGQGDNKLNVGVHTGGPVYAKNGTTVAAKDSASTIILAGNWRTVPGSEVVDTMTVSLISAVASVVSVYRA